MKKRNVFPCVALPCVLPHSWGNFAKSMNKLLLTEKICYGILSSAASLIPQQGDVLAWHLLEVAERGGLAGEAVVGVVVSHDGGGADLTQLVLRTLEPHPDRVQVVLLSVVDYEGETGAGGTKEKQETHQFSGLHSVSPQWNTKHLEPLQKVKPNH